MSDLFSQKMQYDSDGAAIVTNATYNWTPRAEITYDVVASTGFLTSAFDDNPTTYFRWVNGSVGETERSFKLDFGEATKFLNVYVDLRLMDIASSSYRFSLQGSNNDVNWTTLDTVVYGAGTTGDFTLYERNPSFRYYRIFVQGIGDGGSSWALDIVNFGCYK